MGSASRPSLSVSFMMAAQWFRPPTMAGAASSSGSTPAFCARNFGRRGMAEQVQRKAILMDVTRCRAMSTGVDGLV